MRKEETSEKVKQACCQPSEKTESATLFHKGRSYCPGCVAENVRDKHTAAFRNVF